MKSPMWKAFIENQNYSDKEASNIEIAKQQFQQNEMKKAYQQLGRSQNISDYININSKITKKDIDQKTESNPHFKNYDHSLDQTRIRFAEDEADILTNGVQIPKPEPERLRLNPNKSKIILENDEKTEISFGIDWANLGDQLGL